MIHRKIHVLLAYTPFWYRKLSSERSIEAHCPIMFRSSFLLSWHVFEDEPVYWKETNDAHRLALKCWLEILLSVVVCGALTFKSMTDVNVIRHGAHLKVFSCFNFAWCDWIWLTVLNILWHSPHCINFSMWVCRWRYKIVRDLNSLPHTLHIGILPGVFCMSNVMVSFLGSATYTCERTTDGQQRRFRNGWKRKIISSILWMILLVHNRNFLIVVHPSSDFNVIAHKTHLLRFAHTSWVFMCIFSIPGPLKLLKQISHCGCFLQLACEVHQEH